MLLSPQSPPHTPLLPLGQLQWQQLKKKEGRRKNDILRYRSSPPCCVISTQVQVFGLYTREGFHENFDCPIKVSIM